MSYLDVITIGESMVVFNLIQNISLVDSHLFLMQIAGAESNFAIGLGSLNDKVGWISMLSNNSLGYFVNNTLRGNGVDTSCVEFDNINPTGILIKERAYNKTQVHYYRHSSAASFMNKSILTNEYFSRAKYLFITGITPVLSESCHVTIMEAIKLAKKNNLKIIFDPNIRHKLFENSEEYINIINEIASLTDYFLPGIEEAIFLTGHKQPDDIANFY